MKESWIFTISIIAFLCATTLFITGCPNSENSSSVKNGETKKVPPSKTDSAEKSEKTDEPKKETKVTKQKPLLHHSKLHAKEELQRNDLSLLACH